MPLENLVRENYSSLNDSEKYIWSYILHHKKECETASIHSLAALCNVSHSSILRFVKKLGFNGYSEFKYYLKWQQNGTGSFRQSELADCCGDYIKNLEHLRYQDMTPVMQLLESSQRIFVYGTGEVQKNAAREMKRCFTSVNKLVHIIEGIEEVFLTAKFIREQDIVVIFSMFGENPIAVQLAQQLKAKSIPVITITREGENTLSTLGTHHFYFQTHQIATGHSSVAVYPVVHFFLVVEMLFLKYLEYLG